MKKSLIVLSFLLAACQASPVAPPAPVPAVSALAAAAAVSADEDAAALLLRLRTLTADNSCTRDAQCLTVPIGARACGGPEAFLAYSTAAGVKPDAVAAAAQRFSAARAAVVARAGLLSTCMAIVDPGALCNAALCQLRTPANDRR
ncbi:hypothetical protein [Massilia sp. PWRC2]|uniref:hypothetical protein n=1 Tax=Massilia sp. PWRC2 TaxID=2804626 RepID=UPI003CE68557